MSTSKLRIARKVTRGGILKYADLPPDAQFKGTRQTIDGQVYCELLDGRIVRMPVARNTWVVRNGRVVRIAEDGSVDVEVR